MILPRIAGGTAMALLEVALVMVSQMPVGVIDGDVELVAVDPPHKQQ